MFILCPMFLSPSSLESGGEEGVYFCHSSWADSPVPLGIFAWKFIRNILAHSSLKSEISVFANCLVFFYFLLLFLLTLFCIDKVIKTKYIWLELKIPWPFNATPETYNRDDNILDLADILTNVSFTKSETKRDYY